MLGKKITIILLFALAFFLLLANILTGPSEKENSAKDPLSKQNLSTDEVMNGIIEILKEFDVDTLVVKNRVKKRDIKSYTVKLPADLPIPVILKDIYNRFNGSDVKISAVDTAIRGKDPKPIQITALSIQGEDAGKFLFMFENESKISRKKGELGIYINDFAELNKEETQYLLTYPEALGFLILPTKEARDLKEIIRANRKDAGIIISDEVSDIDYKVHSKYSKRRLLMSVKLLIGAFTEYSFFLIDKDAEIYNSTAFAFLESEFNKRNYKIIPTYKFDFIDGESSEVILHKFRSMTRKTIKGERAIISVSNENFITIQDELKKLKKKGVHIVLPSKLIGEEESIQ
ncbi:MAG TPA: hypothetical protein PLT92_00910 [Ignavibacteriaceae bacterium]|nr:hypothetical protein [Ignavibacteriaceae bacterium]HOJ17104.1 hypothetical protein [Ignavibacteriaceae bacterium]HPO56524.1 hypothetical protein [Ignavibacteriaceae bacterium]